MIHSLCLSLAMLVPQIGPAEQTAKPFGAWPIYKNDSILRVPEKVEGEIGDFIRVTASTETKIVKWACLDKVKLDDGRVVDALVFIPFGELKDSRSAFFVARGKGSFRLLCWTALADTPSDLGITLVVVGGAPPVPPGPDPGPGPNPPTPTPAKALRVILVYESSANMTKEQMTALYSPKVQEYLDAKTVKDGSNAGWRRFDKDIDVSNEKDFWKRAWQSAKPNIKQVPAVVILDGDNGTVLPFPANDDALLELLKRYGGA